MSPVCELRTANCELRSGGFTLIEVLTALAIISIVLTALYTTFLLSHKAVDAMEDSVLRLQEMRNVMDIIRKELESSYYSEESSYTIFRTEDRDSYGRQASRLTFTSYSPLRPAISRITYMVEDEKGRLVLKKVMGSPLNKNPEETALDLIEGIGSFSIEVRQDNKWLKTWDTGLTKKMPDEIRVSLRISMKGLETGKGKAGLSTDSVVISEIIRPMIGKAL
ncbi:MAG: type II secretion system protein GspJ [Nitrospirota bacterium]